ncbi:MAG TPA: prepilin-type N-terminal cleavage/methylation domain-containing protein [Candidatus Nitrosotenuis sp.]|nr:prepilin-type N-terminal cleavage/methylation domain-containing protein [Candidatus Nitrosotenuis sp.]
MQGRAAVGARGGFSLAEVLVVIAVFSVFTLTLANLMLGGMQTFRKGEAMTRMRQDLRSALDLISADLRQASDVSVPSTASAEKELELRFERYHSPDSDNEGVHAHTITYEINAFTNQLTRSEEWDQGGTEVLLAENILVGEELGEEAIGDPLSYFTWVRVLSEDESYPTALSGPTLRVVLTATQEGQDWTLTMSTDITQRLASASVTGSVSEPNFNLLLVPSDLRPAAPRLGPAASSSASAF